MENQRKHKKGRTLEKHKENVRKPTKDKQNNKEHFEKIKTNQSMKKHTK